MSEQLYSRVLLPEPGGTDFWRTCMLEHGDDFDHVYTICLRDKDPANDFGPGYSWAYMLGRRAPNNTHGKLPWNEQAAITITVSLPLIISLSSPSWSMACKCMMADLVYVLVDRQTCYCALQRSSREVTIRGSQGAASRPICSRWISNGGENA